MRKCGDLTFIRLKLPFHRFPGQEKERLLDALVNDPLIISQLLNRELSPTVLDLANETNIKIFPASWKDLHMDCNARTGPCPVNIWPQ